MPEAWERYQIAMTSPDLMRPAVMQEGRTCETVAADGYSMSGAS